jgi:predicted MFS family arabinose efflux permease
MAEADDERKQRRTNRGLATALLVMVFTAGSALSAATAAYFVNQPIYPNFPIGCGFAAVVLGLAAVITAGVSASMEER